MDDYKEEFNKKYPDTPYKYQDAELEERYRNFSDNKKKTDKVYQEDQREFEESKKLWDKD